MQPSLTAIFMNIEYVTLSTIMIVAVELKDLQVLVASILRTVLEFGVNPPQDCSY